MLRKIGVAHFAGLVMMCNETSCSSSPLSRTVLRESRSKKALREYVIRIRSMDNVHDNLRHSIGDACASKYESVPHMKQVIALTVHR